ncbi:MAG TPA: SNF2-related protein, partial [Candidatus Pacearchaeota archaeon]|nr:SNF2-related protein [Candidatus Pacearchaeota archaeon]
MAKFVPHKYQQYAIDFLLKHEQAGLFLDMGLGKTVITLTALDILKKRGEINKVLVVAPKIVAENVWRQEPQKWDHLQDLTFSYILGSSKKREKALKTQADIYVVTRDNVAWLVDYLKDTWFFDTLVLDELSSFKNHQSKRFKKLKLVRPLVKRVIGLTGTPIPNGYMDLWSEMYLLDMGERLEKYITRYRRKYFYEINRWSFIDYKLMPGADKIIDKKISDICLSMKAKDYLKLKKPQVIDVKVHLNSKEMKAYKEMEKEAVLAIDEEVITATSAGIVVNKLLQLANGAVYIGDQKNYKIIHSRKLEALEELIEQAAGENVIVYYNYQHDKERILQKFSEARLLKTEKDVEDWNKGKIKMLVAHPASAGHGLNLQDGGSIAIWYGLNWS